MSKRTLVPATIANGYVDAGAVAAPASGVAPWLAAGTPLRITLTLRTGALASREYPGQAPEADPDANWSLFYRYAVSAGRFKPDLCDPHYLDAVSVAGVRIDEVEQRGSRASDLVLLALEAAAQYRAQGYHACPLVHMLVADHGLPYVIDLLMHLPRAFGAVYSPEQGYMDHFISDTPSADAPATDIVDICLALRRHLVRASRPEWDACVRIMRDAAPGLLPQHRAMLPAMLPEMPELANEIALSLLSAQGSPALPWEQAYTWLMVYVTAPDALKRLRQSWPDDHLRSLYGWTPVTTLLCDRGVDAFTFLDFAIKTRMRMDETCCEALACIGTPQALATLARTCESGTAWKENFNNAVRRWPLAAIATLSELVARDADYPVHAYPALVALARTHADQISAFGPWLSAPAWKTLRIAAACYYDPADLAAPASLPSVLVNPPWTAAPKKKPDARQDPLDQYPARISALPGFWTPQVWERPLLAASAKALDLPALDIIGTMLTFPHNGGAYAGIALVRQACTPDSLAAFAWNILRAWLESGGARGDNWALFGMALIGNDDSARRLARLIRVWPGEHSHARAVVGLDVLAMIGSDTALMLLNGIALKVRYKALQERAREKIGHIAAARNLGTEELEDRLAPDLGLDEHGTLLLDFGPRQFRVGFDEALKPYVRDALGARLADLPKPKKTDDPDLAAAAVERYKLLKKDARTIAAQQVLRLELAMCSRRRWSAQVFGDFLAGHPLVRHLVQRLVWGVYDGERLLACFRVAADATFTDAHDEPFAPPQGDRLRIGLPHALDLAPADASAFGQLLADYELLQPFAQIGRDTYALAAQEGDDSLLDRWTGRVIDTGHLLGLAHKGWRRGPARDGGGIWTFTKALHAGHLAELDFSPGMTAGILFESHQQTLGHVEVGSADGAGGIGEAIALSSLDPVLVSELIRDMQDLCD